MVDVHHGQPHLLREKRVVLRDLLHLADERAREGFHLRGIEVLVLQVLGHDADGRRLLQDALHLEALLSRDEDVDAAVREVDAPCDLGDGPDGEKIIRGRVFDVIRLRENEPQEAVRGNGLLHGVRVSRGREHQRREDAGEDRLSLDWDDEQARGQNLVSWDDVMVTHLTCLRYWTIGLRNYCTNLCIGPRRVKSGQGRHGLTRVRDAGGGGPPARRSLRCRVCFAASD